jgi:bifunctional enzyme CysN/CysC
MCSIRSVTNELENMNIVFVGHVDHGKSTIIGRLLADTDSLPRGKMQQVRESCERTGIDFEYAYLIDALKDERSQHITIDSARVFFRSRKRNYTIIDAPGHIEFVKNMVTGAARAEAAIMVIDALEGVRENSRRHGYLLWMLGIKNIIVVINKMDLVGYDQSVYQSVRDDFARFLGELNLTSDYYIPVSGSSGENIVFVNSLMPWYRGKPLLEVLDAMLKETPPQTKPFRMPVQDIYKFARFGDNRRIVTGRITSGHLHVGDEVVFYPSSKRSIIKSIEGFNLPPQQSAVNGQSTGFTLEEQIYVQRGDLVALANQPAPKVSRRFRTSLFWLGRQPLVPHKLYFLKLGTARVKMQVEKIIRVIDASDLEEDSGKNKVSRHDVAECIITTQKDIAFDLAETHSDTSRFVIVDDYEISGGGIILEEMPDEVAQVREFVHIRNQKWIKSLITTQQRAENYNQRAAMIIITGKKDAGRKTTANQLERYLFQSGKKVYYLGIGSVIYGVDADIKGSGKEGEQREHIRRFAEVSYILLDAGLILVVTALELTQEDLEVIHTVVGEEKVRTIWLGGEITTDIKPDMHLPDGEFVEESLLQIIQMMRETGIIFSP